MRLTILQRYKFEELASVGCSIQDALMVGADMTPAQADKASADPELREWFELGRARGAAKLMTAMAIAGAAGSSSAAKLALGGHTAQADDAAEMVRQSRRGDIIDIVDDVDRRWAEFARINKEGLGHE
jgi:hypothetical protein